MVSTLVHYNSIITAHAILMIFFMVEKSFNVLNMKPQSVLCTDGVNKDNNWSSRFSKQLDTEIQAVAPRMNNRRIFNWDLLKTLNPTSNPFFKKTRRNLHQYSEHTRTFATTLSVFEARSDSTNSSVLPVKLYKKADLDKLLIIKENKAKCGVYRWINLTNNKSYV